MSLPSEQPTSTQVPFRDGDEQVNDVQLTEEELRHIAYIEGLAAAQQQETISQAPPPRPAPPRPIPPRMMPRLVSEGSYSSGATSEADEPGSFDQLEDAQEASGKNSEAHEESQRSTTPTSSADSRRSIDDFDDKSFEIPEIINRVEQEKCEDNTMIDYQEHHIVSTENVPKLFLHEARILPPSLPRRTVQFEEVSTINYSAGNAPAESFHSQPSTFQTFEISRQPDISSQTQPSTAALPPQDLDLFNFIQNIVAENIRPAITPNLDMSSVGDEKIENTETAAAFMQRTLSEARSYSIATESPEEPKLFSRESSEEKEAESEVVDVGSVTPSNTSIILQSSEPVFSLQDLENMVFQGQSDESTSVLSQVQEKKSSDHERKSIFDEVSKRTSSVDKASDVQQSSSQMMEDGPSKDNEERESSTEFIGQVYSQVADFLQRRSSEILEKAKSIDIELPDMPKFDELELKSIFDTDKSDESGTPRKDKRKSVSFEEPHKSIDSSTATSGTDSISDHERSFSIEKEDAGLQQSSLLSQRREFDQSTTDALNQPIENAQPMDQETSSTMSFGQVYSQVTDFIQRESTKIMEKAKSVDFELPEFEMPKIENLPNIFESQKSEEAQSPPASRKKSVSFEEPRKSEEPSPDTSEADTPSPSGIISFDADENEGSQEAGMLQQRRESDRLITESVHQEQSTSAAIGQVYSQVTGFIQRESVKILEKAKSIDFELPEMPRIENLPSIFEKEKADEVQSPSISVEKSMQLEEEREPSDKSSQTSGADIPSPSGIVSFDISDDEILNETNTEQQSKAPEEDTGSFHQEPDTSTSIGEIYSQVTDFIQRRKSEILEKAKSIDIDLPELPKFDELELKSIFDTDKSEEPHETDDLSSKTSGADTPRFSGVTSLEYEEEEIPQNQPIDESSDDHREAEAGASIGEVYSQVADFIQRRSSEILGKAKSIDLPEMPKFDELELKSIFDTNRSEEPHKDEDLSSKISEADSPSNSIIQSLDDKERIPQQRRESEKLMTDEFNYQTTEDSINVHRESEVSTSIEQVYSQVSDFIQRRSSEILEKAKSIDLPEMPKFDELELKSIFDVDKSEKSGTSSPPTSSADTISDREMSFDANETQQTQVFASEHHLTAAELQHIAEVQRLAEESSSGVNIHEGPSSPNVEQKKSISFEERQKSEDRSPSTSEADSIADREESLDMSSLHHDDIPSHDQPPLTAAELEHIANIQRLAEQSSFDAKTPIRPPLPASVLQKREESRSMESQHESGATSGADENSDIESSSFEMIETPQVIENEEQQQLTAQELEHIARIQQMAEQSSFETKMPSRPPPPKVPYQSSTSVDRNQVEVRDDQSSATSEADEVVSFSQPSSIDQYEFEVPSLPSITIVDNYHYENPELPMMQDTLAYINLIVDKCFSEAIELLALQRPAQMIITSSIHQDESWENLKDERHSRHSSATSGADSRRSFEQNSSMEQLNEPETYQGIDLALVFNDHPMSQIQESQPEQHQLTAEELEHIAKIQRLAEIEFTQPQHDDIIRDTVEISLPISPCNIDEVAHNSTIFGIAHSRHIQRYPEMAEETHRSLPQPIIISENYDEQQQTDQQQLVDQDVPSYDTFQQSISEIIAHLRAESPPTPLTIVHVEQEIDNLSDFSEATSGADSRRSFEEPTLSIDNEHYEPSPMDDQKQIANEVPLTQEEIDHIVRIQRLAEQDLAQSIQPSTVVVQEMQETEMIPFDFLIDSLPFEQIESGKLLERTAHNSTIFEKSSSQSIQQPEIEFCLHKKIRPPPIPERPKPMCREEIVFEEQDVASISAESRDRTSYSSTIFFKSSEEQIPPPELETSDLLESKVKQIQEPAWRSSVPQTEPKPAL